jgi:hypothetical protein
VHISSLLDDRSKNKDNNKVSFSLILRDKEKITQRVPYMKLSDYIKQCNACRSALWAETASAESVYLIRIIPA